MLVKANYQGVQAQLQAELWDQLKEYTVEMVLYAWLGTLGTHTKRSYRIAFEQFEKLGLLHFNWTLQEFSLSNHEAVIDKIKLVAHWSEATRQARAAAYISFTGYLQRRSRGLIHKAVPNKEGVHKTFYKIRDKVKTRSLTLQETTDFLQALEKLNKRDALIAKLMLQGGKRKNEVLTLQIGQVNFRKQEIQYRQSKTKGVERYTIIHYPANVIKELKKYIAKRKNKPDDLVFITGKGKKVYPYQIDRNFLRAGKRAHIAFPVSPHVLRVTLVTRLKEQQVQDTDIMKVTGHATVSQVASYDRGDLADNITKTFNILNPS